MHKHRQACARTDKHRIIALFVEKVVYRDRLSDNRVGLNLHAELFNIFDFMRNHRVFRQSEFRNAVDQHTARLVECLKNLDLIAEFSEVARTGESRRPCADYSDPLPVFLGMVLRFQFVLTRPVCHVALQLTDCNRLSLDAADADAFALRLLRTHAATNCRKCRALGNDTRSLCLLSGNDLL